MSSPAKQPPAAAKKGGWGSVFSSAVAGLESKLDTILAEDGEASARSRAAEQALKDAKAPTTRPRSDSDKLKIPSRTNSVKSSANASRDASRSRASERLAERLAKVTAAKSTGSAVGSELPSRTGTPVLTVDSPRSSGEERRSTDIPRSAPEEPGAEETIADTNNQEHVESVKGKEQAEGQEAASTKLQGSGIPTNPARQSGESVHRPSILELDSRETSARPSTDLSNGLSGRSMLEVEAETAQMRADYEAAEKQRQEEMHTYLERIDALQSKLQYLAKETVAAAKEANASTDRNSTEAKLAEKDERIALLMEEGEKLSKTELKHTQTIKKLRTKQIEGDKLMSDTQSRISKLESQEKDLKAKLLRSERAERQAMEKVNQIDQITKQVDDLRTDRENASDLIKKLTQQLRESETKAAQACSEVNSAATEADKNKIAALENEVEDAKIEKQLAEDRAVSEIKRAREEAQRQLERFSVTELELKNELSTLEARMEATRSRAEEAGVESGGDANVKLLRQIETHQSQYALAKENWETIEGSLNARVAALEKERDEAARREAEVRKKARDAGMKGRKAEEELESRGEEIRNLIQEVKSLSDQLQPLRTKLEQSEAALADARGDLERQRRVWDMELTSKVEEEKAKWQRSAPPTTILRTGSPAMYTRKTSTDVLQGQGRKSRLASQDLTNIQTEGRPNSRRGSVMPTPIARHPITTPDRESSPVLSRQESTLSMLDNLNSIPPTPSVEIDEDFDRASSPQRTINDIVSTSNASGAGPSVQLVERMSAAVRRLESEKASDKDELVRLTAQRDDARNEVVGLMREIDTLRTERGKVDDVAKELTDVKRRYDASLEMLGEREEEVEELKADVKELKRIYRELVESKVGGK